MLFAKHLRDRVRSGEITASVRIWKQPRVKVGRAYPLAPGSIVIDRLTEISFDQITPQLARRSGFNHVGELMDTAQHGSGQRVFIVEFRYVT